MVADEEYGSANLRADGGETAESSVDGTDRCYNPLCEAELTCDPGEKEGYCSWECAVMARSGTANRILREQERGSV